MARPKRGAKRRGTPSNRDSTEQKSQNNLPPISADISSNPDETSGKKSKITADENCEVNAIIPATAPLTESNLINRLEAPPDDSLPNTKMAESPVQSSTMSVAGSIPSLSQLKGASSLSNDQQSEDNGSQLISPESQQPWNPDDVGENPLPMAAKGLSPSSVSALNCEGHKLGIGYKRAINEQLPGTIGQEPENRHTTDLTDLTPFQLDQSSNTVDGSSIRMANTAAEASESSGPGDIHEESGALESEQLGEADRARLASKISNHSTAEVDRGNPTHIGANLPRDAGGEVNLSLTGDASGSSEAQSEEKEPAIDETVQQGEERQVLERTRETLQKILDGQKQDSTKKDSDGRRAPPPSESTTMSTKSWNPPRAQRESSAQRDVPPLSIIPKPEPDNHLHSRGDTPGTQGYRMAGENRSNVERKWYKSPRRISIDRPRGSELHQLKDPKSLVGEDLGQEKMPWIVEFPGSRFYRLPWPLKSRSEGFRALPKAYYPEYNTVTGTTRRQGSIHDLVIR